MLCCRPCAQKLQPTLPQPLQWLSLLHLNECFVYAVDSHSHLISVDVNGTAYSDYLPQGHDHYLTQKTGYEVWQLHFDSAGDVSW